MMSGHITESTIARVAGNIASGMVTKAVGDDVAAQQEIAKLAVALARAIAREVERVDRVTPRHTDVTRHGA